MKVTFAPNDKGNPPGKLADAEIHFDEADGILAGMKLIGFSIWERRGGSGRNVTFPARQYSVNGDSRSFALLRPTSAEALDANRVRDFILSEFEAYEALAETNGNGEGDGRAASVEP